VHDEFGEYVLDLLSPLGDIELRRFFGGKALVADATQFAMIMGSTLYFVVDDTTRPDYEEAGSEPFSYATMKGRVKVRRYYEVPEEILDNGSELLAWAEEALTVAAKK
jgi:DNA transformation protein